MVREYSFDEILEILKEKREIFESQRDLENVASIITNAINTQAYNIDCGIFIVGERGTGKSTLAQLLSYLIRFVGFEIGRNYKVFVYLSSVDRIRANITLIKLREKIRKEITERKNKNIVVVFDEMHLTAYKRDFSTRKQKELVKTFKLLRPLNLVYFYVTQYPNDIDIDLRRADYMHWLLVLLQRGKALVYTRYIDKEEHEKSSVAYVLRNYDRFNYLIELGLEKKLRKEFPPYFEIKYKITKDFVEESFFDFLTFGKEKCIYMKGISHSDYDKIREIVATRSL